MSVKAIILSTSHQVFQGQWQVAASYAELKIALREKGIHIDSPAGIRPPEFCFIFQGEIDSSLKKQWISPAEVFSANPDIWNFYCQTMLGGWVPPTQSLDVFHFGGKGVMAAKLAHLVAKGEKRLTAGWIKSHKITGATIPHKGLISIVTDGFGIPVACIETEKVECLPFKSVTAEMARREGEGDLTLPDWREGHLDYWKNFDAKELGLEFSEDEEIFVEQFQLRHVFSAKTHWDQPKVYLIVGPTGSGKSTITRRLATDQKLHSFSIDEWMRQLFWKDSTSESGLDWALERCARCETVIVSQLKREIELGRGAILDLGFSKKAERLLWKKKCEELGARPEFIFLDAPVEERWSRVERRNQMLSVDQQSIKVDRATFDWMETFYEPVTDSEKLELNSVSNETNTVHQKGTPSK